MKFGLGQEHTNSCLRVQTDVAPNDAHCSGLTRTSTARRLLHALACQASQQGSGLRIRKSIMILSFGRIGGWIRVLSSAFRMILLEKKTQVKRGSFRRRVRYVKHARTHDHDHEHEQPGLSQRPIKYCTVDPIGGPVSNDSILQCSVSHTRT